jgi:predicted dehydrogenase
MGKNIVEAVQGKSKRLRFIRGVSKEPELVREFAAAKGFELSTEFEEAVSDPRVQAIFLATPHSLHVPQICAVAAAGKPVWCEKPLALRRAEAESAIAACAKAGVPFALGNNKRCFPSMRELKRTVADGLLGEILHVEGNFSNEHSTRVKGGWRDDPRESPGGGMTGAGLHVLDAFVNLAGPIVKVDARVYSQKPPPDPRDAAAALVQFREWRHGGTWDGPGRTDVLADPRIRNQRLCRGPRRNVPHPFVDWRQLGDKNLSGRRFARCAPRGFCRDDRDRETFPGFDLRDG